MPKFSIVIPCYNSERFVATAIRSCLDQTSGDLEVIVVDDGSNDGSAAAIQAAAVDPRVVVLRQPNAGLGAARNAGLRAARGAYLNFLDADDLLEPSKLERQGRVLDENPGIGIVLCDGIFIEEHGKETGRNLVQMRRFLGPVALFDLLFSGGQFPPHVPLLRRSLALEAGGMAEPRAMAGWADTDFWLKIALLSPGYHLVDEPLCRYRVHGASMSTNEAAMETAARLVYTTLMEAHPEACARALRHSQRRLVDLEMATLHLRGSLDYQIGLREAAEAALREETTQRKSCELETVLRLVIARSCDKSGPRPIVIWGAGSGGRRVERLIAARGGAVAAFVDSDPLKSGTRIAGVPVIQPAQVGRDVFVLVASSYAEAIEVQLHAAGLVRDLAYVLVDFQAVEAMERAAASASADALRATEPVV